jgi:hypothetical protein
MQKIQLGISAKHFQALPRKRQLKIFAIKRTFSIFFYRKQTFLLGVILAIYSELLGLRGRGSVYF